MDHFHYKHGKLYCEDVETTTLADRFGTPLYIYSQQTLLDHYHRFTKAFAPIHATICFSVKCCHNLSILRLLCNQGASFDVVSGGEIQRVVEAGADPSDIVFAGVGKTEAEIRQALEAKVGWFNVESAAELESIAAIASGMRTKANVALRVNPDVDPHTHEYTTTGLRQTKFGIDFDRVPDLFRRYGDHDGVDLCGLHAHIGSPVNTVEPYVKSISKLLELIDHLQHDGYSIRAMNIGGGFGAHYDGNEAPSANVYAKHIIPLLADRSLKIMVEPGRSIAANAGVLLARTIYTKSSGDRKFVIVDASLTELIRPALYGSFHFAWPVQPQQGVCPPSRCADLHLEGSELIDVVGPVCESGDFLAKDRWLPPVSQGDLLAIFSTGAYGSVMSSQYNSRTRPAEVLVSGQNVQLIRRRETYHDLVGLERFDAE